MSGFDYLEVPATGSILIDKENKEKLFEHLDGLEAENKRLREEVKVAGMVAYVQDMKGLKAENAKLRELVRDMDECLEHSKPFCKKCKFQELNCQWFKFVDRMRELGVEVAK